MSSPFLKITIKCKPIVKAFLENNFGKQVFIPEEHVLNKVLCSQLFKNNTRQDITTIEYPDQVEISITESNFIYDGFNINKVNTRTFNCAVESYIRSLTRTNLDSLLLLQEKQKNWKDSYKSLVRDGIEVTNNKKLAALIRKLEKEVSAHELNIKTAIHTVVTDTLKLDFNTVNYETVKKDYYRYRLKKN